MLDGFVRSIPQILRRVLNGAGCFRFDLGLDFLLNIESKVNAKIFAVRQRRYFNLDAKETANILVVRIIVGVEHAP